MNALEGTMATTTQETVSSIDARIRVGGAWLAIGSLAFVVGLVLHSPPSPDLGVFMATIAADPTRWVAAHWASAIALFLVAIAGLIILTTGSRLTQQWWTITAWTVLTVGSLWVTTAALAEATVVTTAAIAGDTATFEAWQVFAEAHAAAFVVMGLAIAVIAGNEARGGHTMTPVWASWIGAVAGIVAGVAFALNLGLGIALGGLVWLVSSFVMSLWILWFGVALARSDDAAWIQPEKPEPSGQETVH